MRPRSNMVVEPRTAPVISRKPLWALELCGSASTCRLERLQGSLSLCVSLCPGSVTPARFPGACRLHLKETGSHAHYARCCRACPSDSIRLSA